MKFGFRTPNLKSSLKARTTGKAKRAVKKAVIPGYGKKGTGWVTNPKKAAYNKVYNKTTMGVGSIFSSSPANKTTKSPKQYNSKSVNQPGVHNFDWLERELQILNESAKIMQETSNPDTFFSRYDLYMQKLCVLANAERDGVRFKGDSPTQKIYEVTQKQEKTELMNKMIDRFWNKTMEKAKKLKTDTGKQNQIVKFKNELSKYNLKMTQSSIDYYCSKQ